MTSIWEGVRDLLDDGGVTEEEMSEVVPRGWRDRAFCPEEVSASGNSDRKVLAAQDAETTNSHKAQKKLGKQVNRVRYDRYVTSLDGLPTHAPPPEEVGPVGESETRSQRPGSGVRQDQELPRGYEGGRWTLNASYQPRSSCTQGGDIWGWRSTWRRRVPPVVQQTPTHNMHVYATVQARRLTNTSSWSTRPPAP